MYTIKMMSNNMRGWFSKAEVMTNIVKAIHLDVLCLQAVKCK